MCVQYAVPEGGRDRLQGRNRPGFRISWFGEKSLRPSGDPSECKHQRRRHSGGARLGGNWLWDARDKVRRKFGNHHNNPKIKSQPPNTLRPAKRTQRNLGMGIWFDRAGGGEVGRGKGGDTQLVDGFTEIQRSTNCAGRASTYVRTSWLEMNLHTHTHT